MSLQKLQNYCAKAERCEQDIRRKLMLWNVTQDEAQNIIDELKKDGFIDEKRYCSAYIHDKMMFSKWGMTKIRAALLRKGIDRNIITQELEKYDEIGQNDKLKTILENKLKQLMRSERYAILCQNGIDTDNYEYRKIYYELKNKLLRHAASQGYDYDTAQQVISSVLNQE
jgi:regulatory protein